MKKLIVVSSVLIIASVFCILIMTLGSKKSELSTEDAKKILQNYLIDAYQWNDDYVLCLLEVADGQIGNDATYRFEVRFKDDVNNVAGRLVANYEITTDGKKIFWYDSASNEMVLQN